MHLTLSSEFVERSIKRLWVPFILVVLVASPQTLANTTIHSITVSGNDALSKRALLNVMVLQPSLRYSSGQLQQDLERIRTLYHEHGYYFATVQVDTLMFTSDSAVVDIALSVKEHEQTLVGTLWIEGNTVLTTEEIFDRFDTRSGNVFYPARLEQDIENLLRRYEKSGYPFVQVEIARIDADRDSLEGRLAIQLRLDEGRLVQINEIHVEGNKDTKADVVVRETRVRPGEAYDEDKVRTIPQRLNRLNIFSSVSEPELYMNARGGALLIRVQEGPTNSFDGVAGYVPGSTGKKGFFTGMVNVGMRNLFGTGRKLNVRWQRDDRFSQELALRYIEPWVFGYPVNAGGSFFQRQQDTTYVRRLIEFKADLMVTENLSLGALYNHENVIPSADITFLFNSSTISTGVEVQYDSRDDIFGPTAGIFYRSDYRIGRKKIFGLTETSSVPRTITVQKIGLDVQWFQETFSHQIAMLGLHGRDLRSSHIEVADMYRFGGAHTMRGYRENQFVGSRIIWSNAEYRFLLARRSFFFGFFDAGYYFRPEDTTGGFSSAQGVKYGYGLGIRLETAVGNIGISFALGEGDSFGQGKIHFGIINEF